MFAVAIIVVLVIVVVWWCRPRPPTLYDRLGGIEAIAAVVNHFSDALVNNPVVGKNSKNAYLSDWHRNKLDRLPFLKFQRTLWVCEKTGGPQRYVPTHKGKCPLGLENAHVSFHISSDEFDAVAVELGKSLDYFSVAEPEKTEVLQAFAAHKDQVVNQKSGRCPFSRLAS